MSTLCCQKNFIIWSHGYTLIDFSTYFISLSRIQNSIFVSKSSLYYYLFIFLWYLQTSTEIRVLLYETIQKHAIKEFWSQEPCKLNKGWEKGNIAPILQMGKWSSDNLSVQRRAVSDSDSEERALKKQQSPETMQNKGGFKPYYTGKHPCKFK